jgi:hypothetical protein
MRIVGHPYPPTLSLYVLLCTPSPSSVEHYKRARMGMWTFLVSAEEFGSMKCCAKWLDEASRPDASTLGQWASCKIAVHRA